MKLADAFKVQDAAELVRRDTLIRLNLADTFRFEAVLAQDSRMRMWCRQRRRKCLVASTPPYGACHSKRSAAVHEVDPSKRQEEPLGACVALASPHASGGEVAD